MPFPPKKFLVYMCIEPPLPRATPWDRPLRMGRCLKDVTKLSFPQRSIAAWNSLSEGVVSPRSVHSLKEKCDKCRYGAKATPA
ncbi:hypothetical protein E2C01_059083 [Portunus trituberculatus]|uniref:Uncharacterized protein n=1 Tax=Portunus trituberculatus TaxID=210409 RepID=A0A5B7H1K9_PORTR|nr:hypothetical protein [Portunus trituberculatus]